jgi:capsular exopolysaccharide synthesis family protein
VDLRDFLNVVRVRKWIIIESVIIVTLVAFFASYVQRPTYQGQASVLVTEKDQSAQLLGSSFSDFSNPERGFDTQVQLVQSRSIIEGVIRKLNLQTTPTELNRYISVNGVSGTNVVKITVLQSDPRRAADIANAIAQGYVDWSRESKRAAIKTAADEIQARLDEAKTEILSLGKELATNQPKDKNGQPIKNDQLTAELDIATGLYSTLAEKLETLRISEQLEQGSGQVVDIAAVNLVPVAPKPKQNAAIGLVLGLAIGLGVAFLIEYLDNGIKSADEAERIFGVPVLGEIPLEEFSKDEARRLTIIQRPGSAAAESYRSLRNSLDFINFEHNIQTLLITSAAPAEGKSTVAANLAASLAQTGKKVVLVSSDFRRPTTQEFFDVQNSIGLSDVLTGKIALKSALQRPTGDQLLVLTSGKMPPNPSELLGSKRMEEVIESLKDWADWVIIDTPPLLAVADSTSLVRWADGVIVVSRAGTGTRDAARRAHQVLDKVGARMLGVIVWGFSEEGPRSGYYSGYYDYYHAYSSKRVESPGAEPTGRQAMEMFDPPTSAGRKVAMFLGRVIALLLGFLLVLAVVIGLALLLDSVYHLGIVSAVTNALGL